MNEQRCWCLSFQLQASLCWQVLPLWALSSSQDNTPCHAVFSGILLGCSLLPQDFCWCFSFSIYSFHFILCLHSGITLLKTFSRFSHRLCQFFFAYFDWQIILYIFVGYIMVICCVFKICNNQIKVINISLSLLLIFNVLGFDSFFSYYLKFIIDCFNCYLNMLFSPLCVFVPLNLSIIPLPFLVSNDHLFFPLLLLHVRA